MQNKILKKKEINKRVIIHQMNVQLFQKSAIIWAWGKLTQGVDGELEKRNSSYWVHVKVQPIGKTLSCSLHDSGDDVVLQVRREICLILRLHHFHCLLVQMALDTFVHKVQPRHLMYAVECGINGMAVLQAKLKMAKFNVTNFQIQWQYFSMTYFDFIDTFTHRIYRNTYSQISWTSQTNALRAAISSSKKKKKITRGQSGE